MPPDASVKKVSSNTSPRGEMGQTYLTSGKRVSMRLWQNERPQATQVTERDYETVGYVISGRAELDLEGQTVRLEPGDSWLVPAGARHAYRILEPLTAVEATAPPAQVHGRDTAPTGHASAGAQPPYPAAARGGQGGKGGKKGDVVPKREGNRKRQQ